MNLTNPPLPPLDMSASKTPWQVCDTCVMEGVSANEGQVPLTPYPLMNLFSYLLWQSPLASLTHGLLFLTLL
jgi:hypothetical protein